MLVTVSSAAMAEETGSPHLWSGYRPTSEITLPFAEVARQSVVRIEATYVRESEAYLGAISRVTTADEPVVVDSERLDADPRLMQIETCRRQGLETCPILSVRGSGSGFIDNGDQLYTCRHVVGDWPLVAALLNGVPIRDILPPLIVRGAEGELLYNSAYSDHAIRFDLIDEDPRLHEERILRYRALGGRAVPNLKISYSQTLQYLLKASDFVSLRSDSHLIAPVSLAVDNEIEPGDVYYLSGFPSRTDLLPARLDGNPDKLLVTSVLKTKLYTPALPLLMAEGLQRPGGSGGIVTNGEGAVVGMSCFADASNAYAFAFDTAAQEAFWTQLSESEFTDVFAELPIEAASRD